VRPTNGRPVSRNLAKNCYSITFLKVNKGREGFHEDSRSTKAILRDSSGSSQGLAAWWTIENWVLEIPAGVTTDGLTRPVLFLAGDRREPGIREEFVGPPVHSLRSRP